jgi:hypothetical protein
MCVLRVTGKNFDAEAFLRNSSLKPYKVFRSGDPRTMSSAEGSVHMESGFNVNVSDAAWTDLSQQISDACTFLGQYTHELQLLTSLGTVEDIRLDFPSYLRIGTNEVVAQFDYFPPELLKSAGNLGIGIELSTYPRAAAEKTETL